MSSTHYNNSDIFYLEFDKDLVTNLIKKDKDKDKSMSANRLLGK